MSLNRPPNDFSKFVSEFKNNIRLLFIVIGVVFALIFSTSAFYTVEPDEEAVLIRFGKYVGTYPPGLHFKLPLGVDRVVKVQTKRVLQEEFGFRTNDLNSRRTTYDTGNYDDESLMLTGDLNVADVEWVVQYQISDPFKFLFQASEPITNIRDVTESIMRRVVGDRTVNEVLTTGRKEISALATQLIQEVLNKYDIGVNIVTVKLQDVNPPEVVKPSFNEVNEAKQEQEKVINQAERDYNQLIPEAKGKAEQMITQAEGQALEVINRAKGDISRFTAVLTEYRKAPEITRSRLYLETMEEVFSKLESVYVVDPNIKGVLPMYNNFIEAKRE
jgi:membrane protease subunit HflK